MLLIVFRVAQGKAWTSDFANQAVTPAQNQSIRFASNTPSSTVLGLSETQTKHSTKLSNINTVDSREPLEKAGSMA